MAMDDPEQYPSPRYDSSLRRVRTAMTNDDNDDHTPASTAGAAEPGTDSTVTDWHGQEVARDIEAAESALAKAGGDESKAEEIYDDIRPEHPSDRFKVPADEREATLEELPSSEPPE